MVYRLINCLVISNPSLSWNIFLALDSILDAISNFSEGAVHKNQPMIVLLVCSNIVWVDFRKLFFDQSKLA